MATLVAIAIGGAVGSLARYGIALYFEHLFGSEFPYGILIANITGSLLIGFFFVLIVERGLLPEIWRPIVMLGFLGGFTTFSTFSLHTIVFLQEGRLAAASVYVLGSVVLSLLAALLGILTARLVTSQ